MSDAEEQLLEFLYACPVGLVDCAMDGGIGMMNPHAMQHLLPLAGDRDTDNLFEMLADHAPELRNLVTSFARPTGRICDGHRIFVELGTGGRRTEPLVLACTMVRLGPDRLMATLSDVSRQVAQERRLRLADSWFSTLLDTINDYAVVAVSPTGVVASVNDAFTRQTGHDCAALRGRPLADALGDDAGGGALRLDEQIAVATRDGWHLQQGWQKRADGGRYWCQRLVVAHPGADAADGGFAVVLRDVPHNDATADLHRLLTCDHLTGAANRMQFSRVLEGERASWARNGRPLSLVTMDLDHFKAVNDTHGHPVGDAILCRAVEACSAVLPHRALFCRLGGEEFGALLPDVAGAAAAEVADRMRQAVAAIELLVGGHVLRVTASLGCATLGEVDGSTDALIALADRRLYAAKAAGRNRVFCPAEAA
jgi:diguanylate cyclase (GGDEF)-like protein/PAS domain S-box-containing protein